MDDRCLICEINLSMVEIISLLLKDVIRLSSIFQCKFQDKFICNCQNLILDDEALSLETQNLRHRYGIPLKNQREIQAKNNKLDYY